MVAVVPVVPVALPRRLETPWGAKPAWKGTFWPTAISASLLLLVRMSGVERMLTLLSVRRAWSTTPKLGMFTPRLWVPGTAGPWMPVSRPPNWSREPMDRELRPPSSEPMTTGVTCPEPPTFGAAPVWNERPNWSLVSRPTSMITASTKTCRWGMSSLSMTLLRFL